MNIFIKLIAFLLSLPARAKGMKFGKNSWIGPGYDFLFVSLKGVVLEDNVMIGSHAWLQVIADQKTPAKIVIGNGTQIGRHAVISAASEVKIGKKCLISYNVSILDNDHDTGRPDVSPMDSGLGIPEKVVIDDHCFIGAHSFILKGVELGRHCVVGANSVVTKSFPANSVIAGSPAKLIRKLFS